MPVAGVRGLEAGCDARRLVEADRKVGSANVHEDFFTMGSLPSARRRRYSCQGPPAEYHRVRIRGDLAGISSSGARVCRMGSNMAIKVLVIDTDETFSRNLAQRLLDEGCQVFTAATELRAKKIVQREKIDVTLLGLNEEGHWGLSMLGVVKRIRPLTQVILMLSAECLSLSIEGMRRGAFDDLLLPFDMETLLVRIKAAYEHKQELRRSGKAIISHHHSKTVAAGGKSEVIDNAEIVSSEGDVSRSQTGETEDR